MSRAHPFRGVVSLCGALSVATLAIASPGDPGEPGARERVASAFRKIAGASNIQYQVMMHGEGEIAGQVEWFSGLASIARDGDGPLKYRVDGHWMSGGMPQWGVRRGTLADDGEKLRFMFRTSAFADDAELIFHETPTDSEVAGTMRSHWLWLAIPNAIRIPELMLESLEGEMDVVYEGTADILDTTCELFQLRPKDSEFWDRVALLEGTDTLVRLEAMVPPPVVRTGGALVTTFWTPGSSSTSLGLRTDQDEPFGWWTNDPHHEGWFTLVPPEGVEAVEPRTSEDKAAEAEVASGVIVGAVAPDWTLKDTEGRDVALSSLRGKVVVVDFWATWCAPCKKAIPALSALQAKHCDRVAVVSVTVDEVEPKDVAALFSRHGGAHRLLHGGGEVSEAWGVTALPTCVVIDERGVVLARHVGWGEGAGEEIEGVVDAALGVGVE